MADSVDISIVLPILNEEENLEELYSKITNTLTKMDKEYEIIAVDDGSTDKSFEVLKKLNSKDPRLKAIKFRRNFGQTAAMSAGFNHARGSVIITMDSDLQNDPADIPRLLDKIDEGYDVVSGWRKHRKDPLFSRRIPSWTANKMIVLLTGIKVRDSGCTLKAIRRDIIDNIKLYGEMHRFIPALSQWMGARIAEIEVTHHPRTHGKAKYNLNRTMRVALDLINVKFLLRYFTRPNQLFGSLGIFSLFAGMICGLMSCWNDPQDC